MKKYVKIALKTLSIIILLLLIAGVGTWLYIRSNLLSFEPKNKLDRIDQLSEDGYTYFDRNANGQLDVYENTRRSTDERVADLLDQMTVEEKIHLLKGSGLSSALGWVDEKDGGIPGVVGTIVSSPRFGLPAINLSDGPAGLRIEPKRSNNDQTYYCTAFPIGTLLSSTWNTELVNQVGVAMGKEALEYGIDVILGPGANIHRHPLCGRNFEYYSEDPVLTGDIGAAMVNGIESNGIGTAVKHFVANNQETNRNANDVIVSERAMREIYLKGFERIIKKSQPWSIMSSYNKINGTYVPESNYYLNEVLRNDWGFKGLVMTDWFGGKNAVNMVKAGNDLLEPGTNKQWKALKKAYKKGDISDEYIDISAGRILKLIIESKKMEGYKYSEKPDLKAHAKITRESASEGIVLLKNNQALPLENAKKIALLGMYSYNFIAGGTGSGDVNEEYVVSLHQGITNAGLHINTEAQSLFETHKKANEEDFAQQDTFQAMLNPNNPPEINYSKEQLRNISKDSDLAIITIGRNSGEGGDRVEKNDFLLKEVERQLIQNTCEIFHKQNKKVIVVLNIGGVIETASWKDYPDAIVLAWQGGQEGGNAVADILIGSKNPSGKLPMTFPKHLGDHLSNDNFPLQGGSFEPLKFIFGSDEKPDDEKIENVDFTNYEEGIFIGYRYFDYANLEVSYPFGYGLSYSEFDFSDLTVELIGDTIDINIKVNNIGEVAGKEVTQVYIGTSSKSEVKRPVLELKAFGKTDILEAGESFNQNFQIPISDLVYWDESANQWSLEKGTYIIKCGNSSRNLKLAGEVVLE